jgi:ubiquinone/menaquinone biosynthesis C-methylase UbiE|tara:strand:- start:194 stop:901 length:708 start_codon:yes stop_codon:yes gene_type:complete
MKSYEKLASVYNKGDWGKFSLEYLKIINAVKRKFKFKPKSALDIACGTGNLIGELKKKGLDSVGTDLSSDMIKVSKKTFSNVKFYIQDMSKLKVNKKFDLILCPFDSLNYLKNIKQIQKTFRKVREHLTTEGIFIFDFNTPHLYITKHKGTFEREISGIKFKHICIYDKSKREGKTIFDFGKKGKETHIQKAYTRREITSALKREGFQILDIYGNFELEKPNRNSNKLFFVVKKK